MDVIIKILAKKIQIVKLVPTNILITAVIKNTEYNIIIKIIFIIIIKYINSIIGSINSVALKFILLIKIFTKHL